jgi:hypothetical protein
MQNDCFLASMDDLRPSSGCAIDVAIGLICLKGDLTPHHSLTSRRYSVSSLLRRHLDKPIERFLNSLSQRRGHELLLDFKPSRMLLSPPRCAVNTAALGQLRKSNHERPTAASIGPVQRSKNSELFTPIDLAKKTVRLWDSNFRYAIHVIGEGRNQRNRARSSQDLATLESLRTLACCLLLLSPNVSGVSVEKMSIDHPRYCELCWRTSMRWSAPLGGRARSDANQMRLSERFCCEHDPRCPTSSYRVDLRYKNAFHRELRAQQGLEKSAFLVLLVPPSGADTQELRKLAYDQVHARIGATAASVHPYGTRETAALLKSKGLNQSEIARQMGMSRQAVSKALRSFREIVTRQVAFRFLDPKTGEVVVTH